MFYGPKGLKKKKREDPTEACSQKLRNTVASFRTLDIVLRSGWVVKTESRF